MSEVRREYTHKEQQQIVDYICETEQYYSLRGNAFWRVMQETGKFDRTWQSLKEHFKKVIYPNLFRYDIDKEKRAQLKGGYEATQRTQRRQPKREERPHVYDVEL